MQLNTEYEKWFTITLKNKNTQIGNIIIMFFVNEETNEYYFFTKNYTKSKYYMIFGILGEYMDVEWKMNEHQEYKIIQNELNKYQDIVILDKNYSQILLDKINRMRKDYFKNGINISEKQKRYCRCVAHIKSKQSVLSHHLIKV